MADGTSMTDDDVTKAFADLESLVAPEKEGTMSALRQSWHYLQVFAGWGLRLPADEESFKLVLRTSDLARFAFIGDLSDGSAGVRDACRVFQSETLPDMIKVGSDLQRYAKNASNVDGEMFSIIIDLLEGAKPDPASALDLLSDLKKDADKAVANADKAAKGLGDFQSALTIAAGKIARAKKAIDEDNTVNDDKVKTLSANDPAVAGSIAELAKMHQDAKDEYDHDVVVASTSVTYSWVGFPLLPIGLIAAASVAGVYGDKAVKKLAEVDALVAKLKDAKEELSRAIGVQGTYNLAENAVSNMSKYTELAIQHAVTVRNGWQEVLKLLAGLTDQVSKTMTSDNGQDALRKTSLVKVFLGKTEEKWRALAPYLDILTNAPYIQIAPNPVSIAEFMTQVQAEVKKAA